MFAFGRVILELFTGDVPFRGNSDLINITLLVINGDNPAKPKAEEVILRGFDDHMWRLMEECWQKEASARPSAQEVAQRLRALIDARVSSTVPEKTSSCRSSKGVKEDQAQTCIKEAKDSARLKEQRAILLSNVGVKEQGEDDDDAENGNKEYGEREAERTIKRRRGGDGDEEERGESKEERKRRRQE